MEAIRPNEILDNLEHIIPNDIIEIVNRLLKQKFRGDSCTIEREEIIKGIQHKMLISRDKIFDNKWLDFEKIYRDKGWKVSYSQPGWGDSDFKAYYKFSVK